MKVAHGRIVEKYLACAVADMLQNKRKEIRCPCRNCKEAKLVDPFVGGHLKAHLLMYGFMDGYTRWISEDDVGVSGTQNNEVENQNDQEPEEEWNEETPEHEVESGHGQESGHGEDAAMSQASQLLSSVVQDPHVRDLLRKKTTNARAASREESKLAQLELDSKTPLYAGCEETRLSFTLNVLQTKAKHKWSDRSLDEHFEDLQKAFPKGNVCPSSIEEAKKIICPLDLPHVKYHACINDCIIYRNEDADKTVCPVCNAERYKTGKKSPRKVVWYFPLIPRLQRYYVDPKEAKHMRWHAERSKPDDGDDPKLRHPADASQWRALDCEYQDFAAEPRNIRLGVSTNGLNPFGNQSSTHSTWPVFVWMYNLPPGCA